MTPDEQNAINASLEQLGQDILNLRRELHGVRREAQYAKGQARALTVRVEEVGRYRQALVDLSWATSLEEAQAIAREAIRTRT